MPLDNSDSDPERSPKPTRLLRDAAAWPRYGEPSVRSAYGLSPEGRVLKESIVALVAWLIKHFDLSLDAVLRELQAIRPTAEWAAPDTASASVPRLPDLTRRELEVLGLIGAGVTNERIALQLFISFNTVRTHVRHLHAKTGTTNRGQLLAWWARHQEAYLTQPQQLALIPRKRRRP